MSLQHTIRLSDGQLLTGRLWRKSHSFFNNLPFFSDIPRMDEMAGPLETALADNGGGYFNDLLVVSVSTYRRPGIQESNNP